MAEGSSFADLIHRVRSGDADASTELVRRYEPAIRLAVRARLTDSNLRRLFDSQDICQSVLASFFLRAAAGQYEIEQPGQLIRLLEAMARNKFLKQYEKQQAARRDYRRAKPGLLNESEVALDEPGPSTQVANAELIREARRRLSEEELRLVDLRAEGRSWDEIAAATGEQANAVRMRLSRALDRVSQELGLEE